MKESKGKVIWVDFLIQAKQNLKRFETKLKLYKLDFNYIQKED